MQDGRPVACYSKKLNKAQLNYTTMEQELLSIVMTLKEFRSMLLGAELHIHTNHKNLTFNNLQTQRVLRWRCFVEEYNPTLQYIPGPKNTIADTFSRLHCKDDGMTPTLEGKNTVPLGVPLSAAVEAHFSLIDDHKLSQCFLTLPDEECYLNLPHTTARDSPLNFETIKESS